MMDTVIRYYKGYMYHVDEPTPDEPFVALYYVNGYPHGVAFPTREEAQGYLNTNEDSGELSSFAVVTYDELQEVP